MRRISLFALSFFFLAVTACSQITTDTDLTGPDTNETEAPADSAVLYAYATDYASPGQLYQVTVDNDGTATLADTGVTDLGSEAVIRSAGNGRLAILHSGYSLYSTDNLQILDPSDDFETLLQVSTGNGTNPHDVAFDGTTAYVSLYNPGGDAANVDADGNPGDIIAIDTASGEIAARFSFADFLADDGDRNANANNLAIAGGVLYVTLQDLESNTFATTSSGLIGMIDLTSQEVLGVITLQGRNPVGLALSGDSDKLFVADMASYDFDLGNFDTDAPYGGIEVVDIATRASERLIADEDLGGYVERVIASSERVYAVVSTFDSADFSYASKLVSAGDESSSAASFVAIDDSGADIRDVALNEDTAWLARRVLDADGASSPVLSPLDALTGTALGADLSPEIAVSSLAVVE